MRLHREHQQQHPETGKKISIGLVRMANINPLVTVTQQLLSQISEPDCRIHFCIYHSQHPLFVRSGMEAELDQALDRRKPEALWQVPAVQRALQECKEANQIFVVFATAVAEVGRDHDYDWAVVEPSSMRSMIQLAGRIQRHRQKQPSTPNMLVLRQNFKALQGAPVAFTRPGFESKDFTLASKDLSDVLLREQYQIISATPRIRPRTPLEPANNLVDLEHAHLFAKLFGGQVIRAHASLWWLHNPAWCAELQRQTPFRKSTPEQEFVLHMEEEGGELLFHRFSDRGELLAAEKQYFQRVTVQLGEGVQPWFVPDIADQIVQLADGQGLELGEACVKFARLSLRDYGNEDMPHVWNYHSQFGAYSAVE